MRPVAVIMTIIMIITASILAGCGGGGSVEVTDDSSAPLVNKSTPETARQAKPMLEELDSLNNRLETLEHYSSEYIETEGEIIALTREIADLVPELQEGYDGRGNLKLKPMDECMEYVDSMIENGN